jgi:hypothetical protein
MVVFRWKPRARVGQAQSGPTLEFHFQRHTHVASVFSIVPEQIFIGSIHPSLMQFFVAIDQAMMPF